VHYKHSRLKRVRQAHPARAHSTGPATTVVTGPDYKTRSGDDVFEDAVSRLAIGLVLALYARSLVPLPDIEQGT
jgi:hypothetical protein